MSASAIKKQVENYLPLLTVKQQTLVLEMIKCFLNVDTDVKRISSKQFNKEVNEEVERIESGQILTQKDAENELSKW